jgi:hypothetical protein
LSGARFVLLSGALARLERALATFMLDVQTGEHGYTEVAPPLLVRDHVLFGTGQLPKFAEDQFRTTSDHWLIPTAEVPLTNLVADEILEGKGITIARNLVGSYITSLEMAGASLTVLELDDELTGLWDAPVHTPALRWGV